MKNLKTKKEKFDFSYIFNQLSLVCNVRYDATRLKSRKKLNRMENCGVCKFFIFVRLLENSCAREMLLVRKKERVKETE